VAEQELRELDLGTKQVTCRIEQRVALVTLNRPEARNALTLEMKEALHALIPALGDDPDGRLRAADGSGGGFCAGGDTKVMAQGRRPSASRACACWAPRARGARRDPSLAKPVIRGAAGPGGRRRLRARASCDLRIFAESAFVTTAYARLGLSGDYGASWFLTQLVVPRARASSCSRAGGIVRARMPRRSASPTASCRTPICRRRRSRGRARSRRVRRSRCAT
jgi:enoyl-CoA hydratase/carnithine racemase